MFYYVMAYACYGLLVTIGRGYVDAETNYTAKPARFSFKSFARDMRPTYDKYPSGFV